MSPEEIAERMYRKDEFSRALGMEIGKIGKGYCEIQMAVRPDMVNGFGLAHGGITYSLSDSAFAFASNTQGRLAVSIETSISHLKKVYAGDVLTATAREVKLGGRLANYTVDIHNQKNELVSTFKGTVFRTDTLWEK